MKHGENGLKTADLFQKVISRLLLIKKLNGKGRCRWRGKLGENSDAGAGKQDINRLASGKDRQKTGDMGRINRA